MARMRSTVVTVLRMTSLFFFFSSRRRHTRFDCDWSSDVCSSDLNRGTRREECGLIYAIHHRRMRVLPLAFPENSLEYGDLVPFDQRVDVAIEIGRASCRERV